ncbi:thioesterase II family protein [Amycolatopsis antarctica]|uniref:thioesterase II family protein n=1 Tax=Amycolatopsis antarctica TaxID=1854586 RepID=UPI0013FD49DB|nr:alpha/beta fold hydrolase [Amycolatopsis antarctica]
MTDRRRSERDTTIDATNTTQRWLRGYAGDTTSPRRLVCFPYAGGTAQGFRPWAKYLPADVHLLAVQYPGRQDRIDDACLVQMDELVEQVMEALRPLADRPLTLFGHSMGASVAYEVAVRLERENADLATLHVSGHGPPHLQAPGDLHRRGDAAILDDVRRLNPAATEVLADPDVLDFVLPAIRADYELVETYRRAEPPRLSVPIVAYGGTEDPVVDEQGLRGWESLTSGPFEQRMFPGAHFFLLQDERTVVTDLAGRMG